MPATCGRALPVALACLLILVAVAGAARPDRVASCRPFTVLRGHDKYVGRFTYRASSVRRSAALTCRMTRDLLKAAYHSGPLDVTKTVYEHLHGQPVGRPTYWLRGGWRCSNGAGGAACWNARKRRFNAIVLEGAPHGLAVTADVGLGSARLSSDSLPDRG